MAERDDKIRREKKSYDEGNVYEEREKLQIRFRHVFYCPNSARGEAFLRDKVQAYTRGKDILDYGCYDGRMVPTFMKMGPRSITGLDISELAIREATTKYGAIAQFCVGDAHRTPFDDETFDLVVGRAIIHHLDFEAAVAEIRRILKPGGHAIFYEPLRDNPASALFRLLTPTARTRDELPLSRKQIRYADRLFGTSEHLYINLFSIPVGMITSFLPLEPDNFLLRVADNVDFLLSSTPLKYWMRSVVIVWQKD